MPSEDKDRLSYILKEIANRGGKINQALASSPSTSGYAKSDPEVEFFRAFDILAQRLR